MYVFVSDCMYICMCGRLGGIELESVLLLVLSTGSRRGGEVTE